MVLSKTMERPHLGLRLQRVKSKATVTEYKNQCQVNNISLEWDI
jgi:hypothetical protein